MKTRRGKKISESIRRLELQICVVLYISLKHEGANKVHLIEMNNENRWQHSWVHAMLRRLPLLSSHLHPWYISQKNMLFCMKREIPHWAVVSYRWSGIVTSSLLTKQPKCTASVPQQTTAQTTTYICSASRGGVLLFMTDWRGGEFLLLNLVLLLNRFCFVCRTRFLLSQYLVSAALESECISDFFIALLSGGEWGKKHNKHF